MGKFERGPSAKKILCLAAGLFFSNLSGPLSAQILDDAANVKILAAQSKVLRINSYYFEDILNQRSIPFENGQISDDFLDSIGCGSISIGNQFADSSAPFSSEISVVIVGDVLNVGNTCGN